MLNGGKVPWWVTAAAQVGFPAAIAVYVLVELRASLERLTVVIAQLGTKLDVLLAMIQKGAM